MTGGMGQRGKAVADGTGAGQQGNTNSRQGGVPGPAVRGLDGTGEQVVQTPGDAVGGPGDGADQGVAGVGADGGGGLALGWGDPAQGAHPQDVDDGVGGDGHDGQQSEQRQDADDESHGV